GASGERGATGAGAPMALEPRANANANAAAVAGDGEAARDGAGVAEQAAEQCTIEVGVVIFLVGQIRAPEADGPIVDRIADVAADEVVALHRRRDQRIQARADAITLVCNGCVQTKLALAERHGVARRQEEVPIRLEENAV